MASVVEDKVQDVSIHAPVMDANVAISMFLLVGCSFNPRARDGREVIKMVGCRF